MAKKVSSGSTLSLRNNKLIFLMIIVLAIAVFLGVLKILQGIYTTETYYVLNTDVPTRTKIVPEMLDPVVAAEGQAPQAALGLEAVQSGSLYTKFPLLAGDILTNSNVGGFEDISTGVPDEWVITSFSVSADNAVGGRLQRGYYFDMMVSTDSHSFYPFINMLVLDTSVSLSNASNANAVNTEEAKDGQTTQYTVGASPADAAILQHIMRNHGSDIKLLISPRQNEYNAPQIDEYKGQFRYEEDMIKNAGEGTDNSFRPLERDAFGRPIETLAEDCSVGNRRMTESECETAMQQGETAPQEETNQEDMNNNENLDNMETMEPTSETTETELPVETPTETLEPTDEETIN